MKLLLTHRAGAGRLDIDPRFIDSDTAQAFKKHTQSVYRGRQQPGNLPKNASLVRFGLFLQPVTVVIVIDCTQIHFGSRAAHVAVHLVALATVAVARVEPHRITVFDGFLAIATAIVGLDALGAITTALAIAHFHDGVGHNRRLIGSLHQQAPTHPRLAQATSCCTRIHHICSGCAADAVKCLHRS